MVQKSTHSYDIGIGQKNSRTVLEHRGFIEIILFAFDENYNAMVECTAIFTNDLVAANVDNIPLSSDLLQLACLSKNFS